MCLKINWFVKTPWPMPSMEVARTGLWAPDSTKKYKNTVLKREKNPKYALQHHPSRKPQTTWSPQTCTKEIQNLAWNLEAFALFNQVRNRGCFSDITRETIPFCSYSVHETKLTWISPWIAGHKIWSIHTSQYTSPINILRKLIPAPVNKQSLQTLIQFVTDEYLL